MSEKIEKTIAGLAKAAKLTARFNIRDFANTMCVQTSTTSLNCYYFSVSIVIRWWHKCYLRGH